MKTQNAIDPETLVAIQKFAERVRQSFSVKQILLYGSRARGDHQPDSDVDVAVVLDGERGSRWDAVGWRSEPAWRVMLETDLLMSLFPMWQDEWDDPTLAFNPWLIRHIKAEGVTI